MVVGDTDATLVGALTARKMGIKVAHVEAGLRCGDPHMQEEINRRIVDHISDVCYTTSENARCNLLEEGHRRADVVNVGNVMIDTLDRFLPRALDDFSLSNEVNPYALLTLHRAENVDGSDKLNTILNAVEEIASPHPGYLSDAPAGSTTRIVPPAYRNWRRQ